VIVGESRYEAGKVAEKKFQNQLHLLDDGFQHRSLARDFDIVLMGAGDFEDRLLPGGRLREPLSSLIRADAVVLPQDVETEGRAICGKSVWRMRREMSLANIPKSPVVFCGLARPEQFFAQVRAMGVVRAAETVFPDHHAYTPDDIQIILGVSRKHRAGGFITTEKDAINLGDLASTLTPLSIVELKMTLDRPADLVNTIMARIAGRMPCS
jgi:tetraacyldisaccharide 4'-kinase